MAPRPSLVPFASRQPTPWAGPQGLDEVVHGWEHAGAVQRNVVLDHRTAPAQARVSALPVDLSSGVVEALRRRGIAELYSHQADAYHRVRGGCDVVIATPTASGKSLCYNLPVLQHFSEARAARALYLFPTKALSRDQEQGLRSLMDDAGVDHGAITYDGDTPGDARRAARERSGVLLTNPDMLHSGILPHHATWARLFANLEFVVVDEVHTYRGVFGSHLANVLRRLQRIAAFHGSSPTFVFASATIGNPAEHASAILGRPVECVSESGAPTGGRRLVVYNPPVVNPQLGIRQSMLKTAVRFAHELVRAGVPTLVFGQSRNGVEVMLKYLRDKLSVDSIDPQCVHAYRGGYLPEQRRRIEQQLRAGEIRCVVATNALELGIDIGSLDAVVCAGYPGSVAGLWQRFGRAGRRGSEALALLVTSSAPLDQFFARYPEWLVNAPAESARIDPDNVEILVQHLKCAAFELPFEDGEAFGDLPVDAAREGLQFLAAHGVLHETPGPGGRSVYHWATDAYPANHVSLRSVSWDNFVIIDVETDRNFAEMDWRSVHTMLHEQAIYQHAGLQYQVERLDYDNHKAFVRKVRPDYYTDAMTHRRIAVTSEDDFGEIPIEVSSGVETGSVQVGLGEISVVEKVVGYKKIKFYTHENVGYGDVRLPEMQKHTLSIWYTVSRQTADELNISRPALMDALRGVASAMHTVACAGLMTDPRDMGRHVGDRDGGDGVGNDFDPTVFLYDQTPGGVGLSPRLFEERNALWSRARELIRDCGCSHGCPACIGPVSGAIEEEESPKLLALRILERAPLSPTITVA
ncbi:MAG: DEAD/DEAH box helicase [Myxococcota bacterium]